MREKVLGRLEVKKGQRWRNFKDEGRQRRRKATGERRL